MYPGAVNSPETFITNMIDASQTVITVQSLTGWPPAPFLVVLGGGFSNAETILVLEKTSNTLTVQRGYQGIAQAWPQGTTAAVNFTEAHYRALVDNINALNAGKLDATALATILQALQDHADKTAEDEVHGFKIEDGALHVKIDGEWVEIAKIKRGTNALGNAFLGSIRLGGI